MTLKKKVNESKEKEIVKLSNLFLFKKKKTFSAAEWRGVLKVFVVLLIDAPFSRRRERRLREPISAAI